MKDSVRSQPEGTVPVMVGFISPPAIRPGGVAVAASAGGVREVWPFLDRLDREEARRRFRRRLLRGGAAPSPRAVPRAKAVLRKALDQIRRYFRGELRKFTCPVDLEGRGSPFEARVWRALRAIPYGETRSYGQIARALRRPRSGRPVGRACGRNPIPVILPCHRVLGADGSLTGFTGGLDLKERLLAIEDGKRGPAVGGPR